MYLALTDGTTTLNLTDNINYEVAGGWAPRLLAGRDPLTVIETIPNINVLGRTATSSEDNPAIVRRNLIALIAMLEQIERGMWGEGGVVVLEYQSAGAAPSRVLGSMLVGWNADESSLPESFNDLEGLSTNTVEGITLVLERRTPWLLRRYTTENLLANTAWHTNPTWAGSPTWSAGTMPNGGRGSLLLGALGDYISPSGSMSITSGLTYTLTFTAARAGLSTGSLTIQLRNSASSSTIGQASINYSAIGIGTITAGATYQVTIVATGTDANARLRFITGNDDVTIAELFLVQASSSTEAWHPKASEEIAATIASTSVPVNGSLAFPLASPTPAPLDLAMAGMVAGAVAPLGYGQMLCITTGMPNGIVAIDLPSGVMGGAFSSVAASALSSGNLLRFTCAVAGQTEVAPRGATIADVVGAANIYQFKRAVAVAVLRSNSTSSMLLSFRGYTSVNTYDETLPVEVSYNGGQPQIVVLGMIYSTNGIYDYRITVAGQIVGQTLDIDRMVIAGLDDCGGLIVTDAISTLVANSGVNISSNWLTGPVPTVDAGETGGLAGRAIIPSADNALLRSRQSTQRVYFDAVSAGYFRPTVDGVTVQSTSVVATRRTAFNNPV